MVNFSIRVRSVYGRWMSRRILASAVGLLVVLTPMGIAAAAPDNAQPSHVTHHASAPTRSIPETTRPRPLPSSIDDRDERALLRASRSMTRPAVKPKPKVVQSSQRSVTHAKSTPVQHTYVPKLKSNPTGNRAIGLAMVKARGWSVAEFTCLDSIWTRESNWRTEAYNHSSGATGIPQALPGSKMSSAGSDWRTNPATQIAWGLGYIVGRYHTPCGAWSFWQSHHWY